MRERAAESALRLDRRTDDQELRPALHGDARDFLAEASRPRTDDLLSHAHAVGRGHGTGGLEPLPEAHELPLEAGVERKLALENGGRDQHDSSAAVGREPAGEVDRVLGLRVGEQRDDDGAVRDRAGPPGEATRATVEEVYVRELHRISWYGTEARIT